MKSSVIKSYLNVKLGVRDVVQSFFDDERGVSPIVSTVLIILIAIVLATFISDELRQWISEVFDKLTNSNIDAPIK